MRSKVGTRVVPSSQHMKRIAQSLLCAALAFQVFATDAHVNAEPLVETEKKHLVYAEAFGKLGLYGLGYEFAPKRWLVLGAASGAWAASGRNVFAATAYLGVGTCVASNHGWFAQLGP